MVVCVGVWCMVCGVVCSVWCVVCGVVCGCVMVVCDGDVVWS
jgi:hypothetical protein